MRIVNANIGAGYTGLSAARKLSQLHPNQKIILVDAQLAGEGAMAEIRVLSWYNLNDYFTSNKEIKIIKKGEIYALGIKVIKNL